MMGNMAHKSEVVARKSLLNVLRMANLDHKTKNNNHSLSKMNSKNGKNIFDGMHF